jgi:hypothetical protein
MPLKVERDPSPDERGEDVRNKARGCIRGLFRTRLTSFLRLASAAASQVQAMPSEGPTSSGLGGHADSTTGFLPD